jgi:hypothetical protein
MRGQGQFLFWIIISFMIIIGALAVAPVFAAIANIVPNDPLSQLLPIIFIFLVVWGIIAIRPQ